MRDRLLWVGCLLYAALFTALGWLKYDVHRNLVDFGIFAQTAASAFGCFCNAVEGSHWLFHFSPILFVAGIAVALVPSPLTLIALQAVAGALTAPPIYAMVRKRNGLVAARLAALVVWLYPPLAGLIFGDFHENGFAPAAVAWMLYAFDAGRPVWTIACAAAVLSIKEDQALFLAIAGGLGAWRFRSTERGRLAAGIGAASVLVLVLYAGVIRPHVLAGAPLPWQPARFYAWSAADLHSPALQLAQRLGFMLLIFVPLLFLPFRSPMLLLAAAPLAEVLLSRMPTTYTVGTHYAGAWIGYVLVAFAAAAGSLEPPRARAVLAWCAALSLLELVVANPLHPRLNLGTVQPRDRALDRFLLQLPRGAGVATQEEAYTHVALRDPNATLLPEVPQQPVNACFVLVDRSFPESARLEEYGAALKSLLRSGHFVETSRDGAIVLYRRTDCR